MFVFKKIKLLLLALGISVLVPQAVFAADGIKYFTSFAHEVNEEAFQISFDSEYAEVGKALTVTSNRENVSYQWIVGGIPIKNSGNAYTPSEEDLEKWIEVTGNCDGERFTVKMYFSKLPVVYINTHDGEPVTSKDKYKDADLRIQGNSEYNFDTTTLYDGLTEIKGRGNSTWGLPKKPYRLKLDKKTDLFGMGKNKNWVLLANYWDESLMRNTYAYDLSGDMGMEHVSTVWVTVVFNGQYDGNYQLCEQIRVDETRVDIFDWEGLAEDAAEIIGEAEGFGQDKTDDLSDYMKEEDLSWITSGVVSFEGEDYLLDVYPQIQIPSINGGYLLEVDQYFDEVSKFKTKTDQPIMIKSPEFLYSNEEMMKFLQDYIQAFEDGIHSELYSAKYNGQETHYSQLVDMDSLVDYWLVTEIFFNAEIGNKSTYMYKDIDELFQMGPIWDMDWSSHGQGDTHYTDKWGTHFFGGPGQDYNWFRYLIKDPYFLIKAQDRYWDIRNNQVNTLINRFYTDYEYLKESAKANGERWGYDESYEFYVEELRDWMLAHLKWLDEQMISEKGLYRSLNSAVDSDITFTVTDVKGNALEKDSYAFANADYTMNSQDAIRLTVDGAENTLTVFINGMKYRTMRVGATVTIPSELFTANPGEKNIIEVKVINGNGKSTAENFITLREQMVEKPDDKPDDKPDEDTLTFQDVKMDSWYYDAVRWAVKEEITSGYNELQFGTSDSCTRAQIVTFLWRAAGSPKVQSLNMSNSEGSPVTYHDSEFFEDVKESSYYYDAVLWAVDQGITTGYSETTFAPNEPCTRAQIVTFLWRFAGSETPDNSESSFEDIKETSYYYNAVLWAVKNHITQGYTDKLFAPDMTCTRAETVTFLYRAKG